MSRHHALLSLVFLALFVTCLPSYAAETVALYLKASGTDIQGDSARPGRQGSIECSAYEQAATSPRDALSGLATGKRVYQPIVIRKQIDKSSPLLWKAFRMNQVIDAVFKFYRANRMLPGASNQFYTVEIHQARIASVRDILPNTLDPATASQPPMEEVTFVFKTISWTIVDGGVTDTDSVQ